MSAKVSSISSTPLPARAFAALAVLAGALAAAAPPSACDTGEFVLRADFEGARLSGCSVDSASAVTLRIAPEDGGRINPSPWYGFHARAARDDAELAATLRYEVHRHRYVPKVSADGVQWRALSADEFDVRDDGSATIRLRPGVRGLYVSAQENLGADFYARWRQRAAAVSDARWQEIGRSVAGRPIDALIVDRDAPAYILILGRQHPPEVSGAVALTGFVDRLLDMRQSCAASAGPDPRPPRCAFFDGHGLVVVPLLNPDGVARGHWRHNLGQTDLNRDWGPFAQPETRAVRDLVNGLEAQRRVPRLVLDFHSTNRSLFYIQDAASPTRPPRFAAQWLDRADAIGGLYAYERAPRPLTETGTSKNYFHRRFGIASITFEVGDEEPRADVARSARIFADALAETLPAALAAAAAAPCADRFCHLAEANAASLVMLAEERIVSAERSRAIARALAWIDEEQARPGAARSGDYLHLEERLVALAGAAASGIHAGRSRQDLHGTARRMMARRWWLDAFAALLDARDAALALARAHAATVVPAYTHGVQAQPTSYGHYLLAFSAALGRDAERFAQGYARLNRSPLGAAALGASGFGVNRHRLAELLGFDAPVENSYDANLISSSDYKREFAAIVAASAIPIGQFAQNLHTQYHDPEPWMRLHPGQTSGSSAMPQKRNPRPIDRLRSAASRVVGQAFSVTLLAHNTDPGMNDYRDIDAVEKLAAEAMQLYARYAALLGSIELDAQRALEEVARGSATLSEVADTLAREADVPLRHARGYASALADSARAAGIGAASLDDAQLARIYAQTVGGALPLPPGDLRRALDARAMLAARRGFGGPQPAEVARSIAGHAQSQAAHRAWLAARERQLGDARRELRRLRAQLAR